MYGSTSSDHMRLGQDGIPLEGGRREQVAIFSGKGLMTLFPFLPSRNAGNPGLGGLCTGMHSCFGFKMAAGHGMPGGPIPQHLVKMKSSTQMVGAAQAEGHVTVEPEGE